MSENQPPKNWRRIGLTALMIAVAATTSVFIVRSIVDDQPFDSQLWRDQASMPNGSELRSRMISDLQSNVLMRGMNRSEVLLLLGNPDPGYFSVDYDLAYLIGSQSGTGAVTRHGAVVRSGGGVRLLTLNFNDQDRVVEWRVLTH